MKKLLKFIIIVVTTVAVVDIGFGYFSRWYVGNHQLPGDYETVDYLLKHSTDDVIVIGSSVALNSVNPLVIGDSINVTMWNGASNAQSMDYFDVMIKSIIPRYKPKLLLLGLRFDESLSDSRGSRASFLIPYYKTGYVEIDHFLEDVPVLERQMLKSNLYRYNSLWLRILLNRFFKAGEKGERGFIGKAVPPVLPDLIKSTVNDEHSLSTTIGRFREILDYCRKESVPVCVFFPPQYMDFQGKRIVAHDEMLAECDKYGVKVYDSLYDPYWVLHPELFYDNRHLNVDGSTVFSSQLATFLKNEFYNDSINANNNL